MPLQIVRNDIFNMVVDAVVNPTDYCLSGSASIDQRVHLLGGEKLEKECLEYKHCGFGDAIITNAYNMNCKYVIHTVGPFYREDSNDVKILESCYVNSLNLALKFNVKSIAFPLIATGTFNFPLDKAMNIAINAINSFLFNNDMDVFLVVYTDEAFYLSSKLVSNIKSFIDSEYVDNDLYLNINSSLKERIAYYEYRNIPIIPSGNIYASGSVKKNVVLDDLKKDKNILSKLNSLGESFGSKLLNWIDKLGFTDVEVYKAAEVSRQLFQKIKNDEKASKKTCLALCLVLPISLL